MIEPDHVYFARRARAERRAATTATTHEARVRHLELAERMEQLARDLEEHRLDLSEIE